MCKNCSDIRWHRLNSNQSKTNCPKNLNSDGLIVREMGPWPECIFRSLLQFLVYFFFLQFSVWNISFPLFKLLVISTEWHIWQVSTPTKYVIYNKQSVVQLYEKQRNTMNSGNRACHPIGVVGGYHSGDLPDSKIHGANMGPIWGRQDPGGPMLAPWVLLSGLSCSQGFVTHLKIRYLHTYLPNS